MPRFLFRIDVSPSTGTGHLRRCLTLAQELKEQGAEVFFACRLESFDIEKYMAHIASGWEEYDWSLTPEEDARKVIQVYRKYHANSVIIDHYRADETYQKTLYESGIKWLQFDGAARYPIWAEWLLNMSPAASEELYEKLKPRKETRLLLGPRYALLRKEFQQWPLLGNKGGPVRRILLTFGGGDDRGATLFCLEATQSLGEHVERVVLLSSSNPKKEDIVRWCKESRANIKIVMDAEETAPYMASADLAITAGGMTVFEMAVLGIPVLIMQIADNQVPITRAWQQCGYGVDMGHLDRLHPEDLQHEIMSLMQDTARREAMSATGKAMVDGLGAQRVAQALLFQEMNEME
jgi:UDP-2,4-diacetamido-2,4,6-trideoxy-beta-L-altropyranose hydrolase